MAGPEAARDVTQDALLMGWRQLPSLRDPDRFLPWLRRILVNRARDVARRDRRSGPSPLSLDALAAGGVAPGLPGTIDPAAGLDRLTDLHRALARLGVDQRAVVGLHYLADLPLPEVAATLGIPLGTAKSRLSAALVVLRRHLGEPA